MNLDQLAELVLLKMHRTDDESRTEAKKYLRSRYEMIWNAHLWRDAMCEAVVPSGDAARVIILPGLVDRVVNVLWNDTSYLPLAVESLQFIYQAQAWRMNKTENPVNFNLLSPSAVGKPPAGEKLSLVCDNAAASFTVSIRGLLDGTDYSETIPVVGSTPVETVYEYDEVISLSKSSTTDRLTVTNSPTGTVLLSLLPAETSRQFQRLSLVAAPRDQKPLSILGKRRIKPLIDDADSPELTGIDNALVALALGDMLEGQRQYAKAQAKFTEGGAIVDQMTRLERQQSASVIRIVPEQFDYDGWRSDDHGSGFLSKG